MQVFLKYGNNGHSTSASRISFFVFGLYGMHAFNSSKQHPDERRRSSLETIARLCAFSDYLLLRKAGVFS